MGIIAAIIIPRVIGIINSSKEKTQLISTDNYVNAVNQQLLANDAEKVVEDGIYEIKDRAICKDLDCIELEYEGDSPKEGTIIVKDTQVGKAINVVYDTKYISKLRGEKSKFKYIPNVDVIEGLTPVVYQDNKWKVVDITDNWYDYDKQEWANAVILKENITKNIGDIVNINNEVKAMLVWIPRYEYKIEGTYGKGGTSKSSPGEIEINLIPKTKESSSKYRIHPAFKFGDEELNGIWVGKFETTGTEVRPTILPNKISLRYQNISEQFTTSRKFNKYISGDSHMAKNSEWGAVAYLTQSKYGKYGNTNYEGINKQVMVNNCSSYITGIGANNQNDSYSSSTCTRNTYETLKGQAASTTGNITGIYDMSGGAWEYVMGVLLDSNGKPRSGENSSKNSGYTGMLEDETMYSGKTLPDSKYYDTYTAKKAATACNGGICYGQSLSETKSWYGDYAAFASPKYPWSLRGGRYDTTTSAGIFHFNVLNGSANSRGTFRVVLTASSGSEVESEETYAYMWYTGKYVSGPGIGGDGSNLETSLPADKNYYLKYKLDDTKKVTEAYACAVFSGEETCVRGGRADYYGYAANASEYTGNMLILKGLQDEGLSCAFNEYDSSCYGGSVDLGANLNGYVGALGDDGYCGVYVGGSSRCESY